MTEGFDQDGDRDGSFAYPFSWATCTPLGLTLEKFRVQDRLAAKWCPKCGKSTRPTGARIVLPYSSELAG